MSIRRRWAATLLPAAALAGALAWPSGPAPVEVTPSQVPGGLGPATRPAPAPQRAGQVRPRQPVTTTPPAAAAPVSRSPAPAPTAAEPAGPTASPVDPPTAGPRPTSLHDCVAGLLAADLDC